MNTFRSLALAAVVAGAAAEAVNNGTPQGEVIKDLPMIARDGTCAKLPKLCTARAVIDDYTTTLTYLCPEAATTHERSTVHVTITKTVTVTPPDAETTGSLTGTVVAPVPAITDTTTTIHSTLTQYKTITLVGHKGSPTPTNAVPAPAVPITGYFSATMPTELLSVAHPPPTETKEPVYTVQTSTPAVTPTPGYDFPTMLPPVINGTTTGVFYSAPIANSSVVHPTPFFSNTTSAHPHYSVPTLNMANRDAEILKTAKGTAGKVGASLVALSFGLMVNAFLV
ncbi:uncharacterized protein EKO05_0004688 [Ascochyta rabiei]|uniref:Uncharacterized protein n=1 Tax=Didymella rabiei TaxID=5454 RepID=A0A163KPC6_DIDRA|nr:uncharacterized protein EKO05_0004688 [Ascochyta rabiei]KZM27147.1 hypothetical protein ST47_g1683 [Ascochyta rabiei]UPX14198.1 hypothetical protein EKO05_0004688 [Ascochyta rabiei]